MEQPEEVPVGVEALLDGQERPALAGLVAIRISAQALVAAQRQQAVFVELVPVIAGQ